LSEKAADDLIRVGFGAQSIELRHHLCQRAFSIGNGAVREELTLLFEAPLTFHKFFTVEVRNGMKDRIALRAGVGQEA
jgi:hypothetical protein